MSFMSHLGQIEVRAKQEGLQLVHAAGDWVDHISWDAVKHLLLPAIAEAKPGILTAPDAGSVPVQGGEQGEEQSQPEPPANAFTTLPTDVLEELREHFSDWFHAELNVVQKDVASLAERVSLHSGAIGDVLKDIADLKAKTPDAVSSSGDSTDTAAVTSEKAAPAPAKKAAAARTASRRAAAPK